ncbi:MAG TPA: DNA repair exonuclease [Candidatus Limnocylindrales bacterium]|nr:DNA repair exonuclease [Candidatus Limnocylindrales bacterium]
MLRLVHTADVHLGARHSDLGERAGALRERRFAAFGRAIDLAIAERVDLFLVAGDLFDSNVQPKRTVDRVAAELRRLAAAGIRTVIVPGTHDVYDRASIYRAYDLPALAATGGERDLVVLLTPDRPDVHFPALDAVVYGPCFPTRRAPHSPLRDLAAATDQRATWKIGLLHASVAIPGRTADDGVVVRPDEIAASGLDYLALGHWHSTLVERADGVVWAYSGAPEPVAIDQDGAGNVLLVTLDTVDGRKEVRVEERPVGRTRFERLEIDVASIDGQPALVERLAARADPDLVLDVVLVGLRPDELDLATDEVEAALADRFFRVRVRDRSVPPLTEGTLPPPDTIAGAFVRDVEARIAELEAAGSPEALDEAADLRDVLRLGRLLLTGHEVTL